MLRRLNKKGQSTLEYAVLIAVVVAALIAMQRYMNRGMQGHLRERTDQIGSQFDFGRTNSNYTTASVSYTNESFVGGARGTTYLDIAGIRGDAEVANITAGAGRSAAGYGSGYWKTGNETVSFNDTK